MTWQDESMLKIAVGKLLFLYPLLIIAILIGCTSPPKKLVDRVAAQPGSGILFASDRTHNWDILLIQADGSGLTRLTDFPGVDADQPGLQMADPSLSVLGETAAQISS